MSAFLSASSSKKQGEDPSQGAKHFFGTKESEQAKGEAEEGDGKTAPEQECVCIGAVKKLRAVRVVLCFEVGKGNGWRLAKAHGEQWQRGQHFDQRRMLRISAEVAVLPVLEAGEEVGSIRRRSAIPAAPM